MAKELIKDTGEDVAKMVAGFAVSYTTALVTMKIEGAIQGAIAEVMPNAVASKVGGGDDAAADGATTDGANEEKGLSDKKDSPSFAAGVILAGYKSGWGPDDVYRKYYDMAVFNIKAQDSVVAKVTMRHRQVYDFTVKTTKKSLGAAAKKLPAIPKDKRFGKKDTCYYRAVYTGMDKHFQTLCASHQSYCTTDPFLNFFKLRYDVKAEERKALFLGALESYAHKEGIHWEYAMRRAAAIGIDADECEMLKVVAIAKVGRNAKSALWDMIYVNGPGYLPYRIRSKGYYSACSQMSAIIGSTVETGWNAAKEGFAKVADTLSAAMDKAADALKALFVKIVTPLKELIDSKLAKKEESNDEANANNDEEDGKEKEDSLDDKLQKLGVARFTPVAKALAALKSGDGKASAICTDLQKAVCDLDSVWKYTPYIQYNCGNPDIVQWFPPIEKIADKHQRLTIAMVDVVYVLARGMTRAFAPICEYADKASESFDSDAHEAAVKKAVLVGGRKLALDYFSLPYTTWRSTWWCGNKVTNAVNTYGRRTVNMQADVLGTVAAKWKPTSKDDVKSSLAAVLEEALESFLTDRAYTAVTLVRETACTMIANLFLSVVGDAIEKIGSGVDDLLTALPPPLSDLKAGELVTKTLEQMVEKGAAKVVAKWAKKSETFMVGEGDAPDAWDESTARGLRYAPIIRNDDDDMGKEQEGEEEEEGDGDGDKKKAGETKGAETTEEKKGTQVEA